MKRKRLILLENRNEKVENNQSAAYIYWDIFDVPEFAYSLPQLVDRNINELKSEYLNWVFEISNINIKGKSVTDFLCFKVSDKISYWSQTLIADKSPYKSPGIYDVLRLRMLELFFIQHEYDELVYRGRNALIAKVLKKSLLANGKYFNWEYEETIVAKLKRFSHHTFNRFIPLLKAGAWLVYFMVERLTKNSYIQINSEAEYTIVTYFPGINIEKLHNNKFYSNYWGPLHDLFEKGEKSVNWIWIYSDLNQFSYRESQKVQRKLNMCSSNNSHRFTILENYIGVKEFSIAIVYFFKVVYKSFFLKKVRKEFKFPHSAMNFFPVLQNDWWNSFRGPIAMYNCFCWSAFGNVIQQLPSKTKFLLYVWENQPWEQCLLKDKDKLVNTKFIGVVHTPACFSLANFKAFIGDSELHSVTNSKRMVPDILAVPGYHGKKIFNENGWLSEKVEVVEALRYIKSLTQKVYEKQKLNRQKKILLVVTGSLKYETIFQLELLAQVSKTKLLQAYSAIIVKPHPSVAVNDLLKNYDFGLPFYVVEDQLSELWNSIDVVFTSNSTSVSLEAFCLKIPLIIAGNRENINLNPLFGMEGVQFVYSKDDLQKYLESADRISNNTDLYFELNPELPRWKKLLQIH